MSLNCLRVVESWIAYEIVALQKIQMSSTNKRWLIEGPSRDIFTPLKRPSFSFWCISLDRISMGMIKGYGERGPPCLRPLVDSNEPIGDPFSLIVNEAILIHLDISLIKCSENPSYCLLTWIVPQLILSKDLDMFSLIAISLYFDLLERMEWMIS